MSDVPVTRSAPNETDNVVRGLNIEVDPVVHARLKVATGLVSYCGAHPVALPEVIWIAIALSEAWVIVVEPLALAK